MELKSVEKINLEFGYDSSMIDKILNVSNLKRLHGHLSGVPCCNSPARCCFNSIHMWLDILLLSNSEDINSEKEARGSQRIQVKGHRKFRDNI